MIDVEKEEELNLDDLVVIDEGDENARCLGIPMQAMSALPLHTVIELFEDKLNEYGMKAITDEQHNVQFYLVAIGTPTGEAP